MAVTIIHEEKYQQFTIEFDKDEDDAELAYARPSGDVIDFTHTFVPKSERGDGLATELIEKGLQYARQHNLKVKATCPAVDKYIESHPEHHDLRV
jgi:uncharacterized protein